MAAQGSQTLTKSIVQKLETPPIVLDKPHESRNGQMKRSKDVQNEL